MAGRFLAATGVVAGAAALLLTLPSAAGALTIGANLNRPANATYGCETVPGVNAFGGRLFLPSGQTSCTYMPSGSLGNLSEGTAAPSGASIATRVRIKVGNVTGPMRITVSRQLGSTTVGYTCCHFAGQSQVFTPRRNGIATVNVRLPLLSEVDGVNGVITQDYLAISVLAPGVPIPAHEIGNPGDINSPFAAGFFPHMGPGQSRTDSHGLGGVQPLIRAEVIPICGLGAGAAGASSGRAVSSAGPCRAPLGTRAGSRRGGAVRIPLVCNLTVACRGRLVLQNRRSPGAATVSAKRRTWATGRFKVGAGKKGAARFKLTRGGKALLRRKRPATVWANVIFGKGPNRFVTSRKLKLWR
ncbi:MAG: hypothetical protein KDB62_06480 [Solirubrobacterales bacterium]|nr:hypothetical protein [Solirubrobacterales bacterium]